MLTPIFRLAVLNDASVISAISRRAYIPAYLSIIGTVPRPAQENYTSHIMSGEVWIIELEGEEAGVLVVNIGADTLLIYSIAVDPIHQGKGLGYLMLEYAETIAHKEGIAELQLYTNSRMEKNLALYRKAGFVEIGRRPHPSRTGEFLTDMLKKVG